MSVLDDIDVCKACGSTSLWGNFFGRGGLADPNGKWDILCEDCGQLQSKPIKRGPKIAQVTEEVKTDPFHFKSGDIYEGQEVLYVEPSRILGRMTVVLVGHQGGETRSTLNARKKYTVQRKTAAAEPVDKTDTRQWCPARSAASLGLSVGQTYGAGAQAVPCPRCGKRLKLRISGSGKPLGLPAHKNISGAW